MEDRRKRPKSRSSSRVSNRAARQRTLEYGEQSGPPNTQVDSQRQSPPPMLPFGRTIVRKISTARERRSRNDSVMPPVQRCFSERRESDSSHSHSSHSVQDNLQYSKHKILEKSRQKARSARKVEEDSSAAMQPVDEEAEALSSVYEKGISTCLTAFASVCETLTPELLRNQFYSLPQPDPKEYVVFADPSNASKNRYSNIPCLDSTRILLEFLLFENGGGYIHANRVTHPLLRNQFILTQGPLAQTIPEFWRMIWQEKVDTIIMLCKTVEYGRRKCSEYFPNIINVPAVHVHGKLVVYLRSRSRENDLVVSTIELKYLSYSRTIIHYHWSEWPDCQAPTENAQTMFTILRRVRGSKTPVVVHCSAGVGRSGTFVALEMCLMTIANTQTLNIQSIVASLRRCRALAVQSFDQYLSLYKLVLQFGQQNGCIPADDVEHFYRIIQAARP
ncbi:hypothetical protein Q1695_009166 [Nippostrongylus brasiliensis]|nr:hypothetical protein Q1695_009166 [Nippostrongylus brasiliensis]